MKKIAIAGALATLAVPALAGADDSTPSTQASVKSPAQQCRALRTAMGVQNFKQTYGTNGNRSNAFGKCVSGQAGRQRTNAANASRQCRAERDDAGFAASHGGKTFAQFYGTGRSGNDAFGRCVSSKSRARTSEQQTAQTNAARQCRTEQRSNPTAFRAKYGTNRNKSNAFGKCVSATARQQEQQQSRS